jgi:two-component system, OmpR family, sensor kinase
VRRKHAAGKAALTDGLFMRQPQSIRFHLAAVFLLFFALVAMLGMFSIWRLSNFNLLSADVAQVWLPTTRAVGDLNNYTSDFRAIEGSNLLSSGPAEAAATEKEMADLDRSIAASEREFEAVPHNAAVGQLYGRFTEAWTRYRAIVNQMLELSRTGEKPAALVIYNGASRIAYNTASDMLGELTDRAVADAKVASDRLGAAYRQAVWLIALVMVIAGVMVVAALIHISRSISRPLLTLADRMRRLAANDTEIDVPEIERRDEIGEMAQATVVFRNNAIELMRSQRTLARQAAMLEEQLAQEQRLALLQRNFVSMASHEFRTPLTIIDGHARRLDKVKDNVRPPEIGERAGKIRSAVLRMTHLIDNLLNSSRLIDGGAGLYFQPADMDLIALLQEVCQLHREMVPGVQIRERFVAAAIPMRGDAKLLFQVFSNLLANAIKYSPGGGLIEVEAAMRGNEIVVAVADHGMGIPASDLAQLFERYHRGSNVSGIVGTGVGLHLVKMVVDLHGGRAGVDSREGEGSRFTIHLPMREALAVKAQAPAEFASAVETPSVSDPPNDSQTAVMSEQREG